MKSYKILEKLLIEIESNKDPFFKSATKFIHKDEYIDELNLKLSILKESLKNSNSYSDAFECTGEIQYYNTEIEKYERIIEDLKINKPNYLSIMAPLTNREISNVYKFYYDDFLKSFYEYAKETYPNSYHSFDFNVFVIDSIVDIDDFLESDRNVGIIKNFTIIKNENDNDETVEIVIKQNNKEKRKSFDFVNSDDILIMIGEFVIEDN